MPKKKSPSQRKYGLGSRKTVKNEMERYKEGKAHSGRGHTKVKNRKQAIAIGLSKARKKGEKAPKKSSSSKSKKRS
jgi:hypothetical protein